MKRIICICIVLLLTLSNAYSAVKAPDVSNVQFEITRVSKKAGVLHWKIMNNSDAGVYIYSFFLLGPAYNIERSAGTLIFDTTPIVRVASCPPNRVAPLLLFFVRSGGVVEGDFADPEVKKAGGDEVSLKIAVGSEPNSVVEEEKRFYNTPGCQHSPYDAVVNWATFLESSRVQVPRP
jgi:hypothetical protein